MSPFKRGRITILCLGLFAFFKRNESGKKLVLHQRYEKYAMQNWSSLALLEVSETTWLKDTILMGGMHLLWQNLLTYYLYIQYVCTLNYCVRIFGIILYAFVICIIYLYAKKCKIFHFRCYINVPMQFNKYICISNVNKSIFNLIFHK